MPVERVLRQHGHILANAEALETLVSGPRPSNFQGLGFRRWTFTRDLLMHFATMEGQIYAPLMDEGSGDAARAASHASAQTAALVADFREHVTRWHGFPDEAQWETYARSIRWLMSRIRERIDGEATDILPLLGPLRKRLDGAVPIGPDHRYVADAWEIREQIFEGTGFVMRNGAPGGDASPG